MFGEATETTLIVDGGADGALELDLDTRSTVSFRLPRGEVDDQPFPLLRLGSWLVVADHSAWMVGPGGQQGEPSVRELGDADYVVPDAEPDRLWLIEEPDEVGTPGWWRLVDASGLLHEVEAIEGLTPVRGVPTVEDGLAVEDDDHVISVYDPTQSELSAYLDIPEPTAIGGVNRDRAAWCHRPCRELLVTGEQGRNFAILHESDVAEYHHDHVWLSGDGSHLAVIVGVDDGDGVDVELHIYDVDAGELLSRTQLWLGEISGSWSLDRAAVLLPHGDGRPSR